ncbi:YlbF family regulator [Alicyclobacillus fructus]|uniref:YlbF family regulator n=1 Tax=Alicyclobacillus fructus TaxID=2816082 RepID=UPI001A8CD478|nr:YlbF family regulator [Alicyclobacillus fructus]
MNPYDHAHALARAIREWEPFQRAKRAKEALEQDEPAKQMVLDFYRRQYEIEAKRLRGEEPAQEELETLRKLFEIVQLHQDARAYLEADLELQRLWMDVQRIVGEPMEDVRLFSLDEIMKEVGRES